MSDAERFLDDARKSFRLAADSTEAKSVARYAKMGRDYLQLAHDAAKQGATPEPPARWWNLP